MAKSVHDDVLDGALNIIRNTANKLTVCRAQPTTYAEANATYKQAEVAVDSGDFTIADDASGRKVTVAQQADISITDSNNATHVALVDSGNSKLLYVTTCTEQALTSGNTVTVPAWKINIQDPT